MKFLRNLLAAILGTMIALGIMLFVFIGLGAAMGGGEGKVEIKNNSVLTFKLNGEVFDYVPKSDSPFDQLFSELSPRYELGEMLNAIENAKTDDHIKGISLEIVNPMLGLSQTQTLRAKLEEFKATGKFVSAFTDIYNQKNYYLSTVADSLYINPVGVIEFTGLRAEKLYFKDFQDKYGVKMEVIRHGKYKSAMEGFIANKMSNANREQTESFLNSIWTEMLKEIATSRHKTIEELNEIADNLGTRTTELAVSNNMVDAAIYLDQYRAKLKLWLGLTTEDKLNLVTLSDYLRTGKGNVISTKPNKIAILYAQGEIKYAQGNETYIGQEAMVKAIRDIKKKDNIKAVVLRINSPGGSALASDIVWRELGELRKVKPIVVSMGDLAASGGYYIACNADYIYALPTTITGSIGVFGALPNISEFAKKRGINAEQVSTNKNPNYSLYEPLSQEFHDVMKDGVDNIYQTFIKHVAKGRGMSVATVDSIGQGRVWTGVEALEIGLVDGLGTMQKAIEHAAKLSNLGEGYRLTEYPRYKKDFKDMFKSTPLIQSKEDIIKETIGEENYKLYKTIESFNKMEGVQARLPYELIIK